MPEYQILEIKRGKSRLIIGRNPRNNHRNRQKIQQISKENVEVFIKYR